MNTQLVIMGVAGCGKSSLAQAVSSHLGWTLIEGDAYHSAHSVAKMREGTPLTDDDRQGWLNALGLQLSAQPQAVMACSALRRSYRDLLRSFAPGLRFVHLDLNPEQAAARVRQRNDHYFHPQLVSSQFAALESPMGENGVLILNATHHRAALLAAATNWLQSPTA